MNFDILKKPWVLPTTIGVAAFTAGAVGGYILGKRNGETTVIHNGLLGEIKELIQDEEGLGASIQLENFDEDDMEGAGAHIPRWMRDKPKIQVVPPELEETYDTRSRTNPDLLTVKRAQNPGHLDLVKAAEEEHVAYNRVVPADTEVRQAVYEAADVAAQENAEEGAEAAKRLNVFTNNEQFVDQWDYDMELPNRKSLTPYVIHKEEFDRDDMGFQQVTLTYYAGDGVVTDPYETPVYNHERLLGPLLWGHGSGDPQVVYIRNEATSMEYEVCYDPKSSEVELHGLHIEEELEADELKHSQRPLKMRRDD